MRDQTPPITFFRERFANEFVKEVDRLAAEAMFDRALATHDAEVRATELEAYATDIDRDYAKDAARMRVAGARCLDCDLRYEERDEYSCGERGRGHYYDQHDLEALGALIIEPTWDGDQARERAAAIRAGASPANRDGADS